MIITMMYIGTFNYYFLSNGNVICELFLNYVGLKF